MLFLHFIWEFCFVYVFVVKVEHNLLNIPLLFKTWIIYTNRLSSFIYRQASKKNTLLDIQNIDAFIYKYDNKEHKL